MNKYKDILKLKNKNSVCLIGHLNPDVDAIASMCVFKNFLINKLKVKSVDIFADDKGSLDFQSEYILNNEPLNKEPQKYDAVVIMDCPKTTEDRLGKYTQLFESIDTTFNIDHHDTNENFANYNFVNVVSSTCEIVYEILSSFNYKFSDDDLSKIYSGIITDTNNFSVGALNNHTFEIAGACSNAVDVKSLRDTLLSNLTFHNLKIFGLAISNAKTYENEQILISSISKEELKKYHICEDDYVGIINKLAQTRGVKLVSFIHFKNDSYYVSMRAKPEYDVSIFAKQSGGGGHKGAAAFISNEPLDKIIEYVLNNFKKILKNA